MTNDNLILLIEAISSGIIDIGDVQKQLAMKKKRDILCKHKNKVWQGSNGYWYTHLPNLEYPEKRRLVKRITKDSLEEVIIDFYQDEDDDVNNKKITLKIFILIG